MKKSNEGDSISAHPSAEEPHQGRTNAALVLHFLPHHPTHRPSCKETIRPKQINSNKRKQQPTKRKQQKQRKRISSVANKKKHTLRLHVVCLAKVQDLHGLLLAGQWDAFQHGLQVRSSRVPAAVITKAREHVSTDVHA
jgi:acyl-CoA thioesterase